MQLHDGSQVIRGRCWRKAFFLRALVAFALSGAVFPVAAADDPAYAAWVKPWAESPATSRWLSGMGLKLIVTTVRGEVPLSVVTNMTMLESLYLAYHLKVTVAEVATNGDGYCHFITNTGGKDAPLGRLTSKQLKQLDRWLAKLPDDGAQLPPPGRRVVVQTWADGAWHLRVYQGNNPPAELKSILGLLANPFDKFP